VWALRRARDTGEFAEEDRPILERVGTLREEVTDEQKAWACPGGSARKNRERNKNMTTRLEQLRANAESVRDQFEDGQASLYRADGSKVYGDDEHAERLAGLRGHRNATLDTIEAQLASEVESANEDIAAFDNGGPTAWLTRDEQGQASASHAPW
jgi:hypothetical protein